MYPLKEVGVGCSSGQGFGWGEYTFRVLGVGLLLRVIGPSDGNGKLLLPAFSGEGAVIWQSLYKSPLYCL